MAAKSLKEALLEIQKQAPKVQEDGLNEYTDSRYMQLKSVLAVVLPLLNEEDILWSTLLCTTEGGQPGLEYSFYHLPTKEDLTRVVPLPLVKASAQEFGSATTYMRRYCLVAALNLVADRDDDGTAATKASELPTHQPRTQEPLAVPTEDQQVVMRQAVTDLIAELKEHPEAWTQTEEWAKERSIELTSPPANKLRAVERALRTKLGRVRAAEEKQAKKK